MLEVLAILAVYQLILMGAILCGFFIFLLIVKDAYKVNFKDALYIMKNGRRPRNNRKSNRNQNRTMKLNNQR